MAWDVLLRVEREGAYADLLLGSHLSRASDMPKADKALVHELVMGVLRWRSLLDRALERLCHRPLKRMDPKVLVLLRLGLYQLRFLSKVPPPAAVNETVSLAKEMGLDYASGFINAVLREAQREGPKAFSFDGEDPVLRIAHELAHPQWMVRRWAAQWGVEEARALCEANNRPAPLIIRTNTLKVRREELIRELEDEGASCRPTNYSPEGIRVEGLSVPLGDLAAYRMGHFQVQDEASQLISHWLDARPGQRILDACAAPGGKTTHLAQLTEDRAKIVAADSHRGRLGLIQRECARLGIKGVMIHMGDLTRQGELPEGLFDRILLDAPCSGLGVLRRHPEAKWRRSPEDLHRLAALQWELLRSVAGRLKPGGILLYAVCTITGEEGHKILERALRELEGFEQLRDPKGLPEPAWVLVNEQGLFQSLPHRHGMDGFTAFKLKRTQL